MKSISPTPWEYVRTYSVKVFGLFYVSDRATASEFVYKNVTSDDNQVTSE